MSHSECLSFFHRIRFKVKEGDFFCELSQQGHDRESSTGKIGRFLGHMCENILYRENLQHA